MRSRTGKLTRGTQMKIAPVMFAVCASLLCTPVVGQTTSGPSRPICQQLVTEIEAGLKRLAWATFSNPSDKTLAQQQLREVQAASALLSIQANLLLIQQHGCPTFDMAITPELYREAAQRCALAHQGIGRIEDLCDQKKWYRSVRPE